MSLCSKSLLLGLLTSPNGWEQTRSPLPHPRIESEGSGLSVHPRVTLSPLVVCWPHALHTCPETWGDGQDRKSPPESSVQASGVLRVTDGQGHHLCNIVVMPEEHT